MIITSTTLMENILTGVWGNLIKKMWEKGDGRTELEGKSHVEILRETGPLGYHVEVWPTSPLKGKASHYTTSST